ncbi:hypothetical protein SDC9_197758 [bioreactor metagenome]|uniref:Uncharacterized protein n=1 Tax=bioreactor metagenome TaxID=1076179 RepID=A0A645IH14_9ZZZZ
MIFECEPFHRLGKFFPVVSRFTHFLDILPVIFIMYPGKTFLKLTTLFLLTHFLFPLHSEIGQAFRMEAVSHSNNTYVEVHHILIGRQRIDKINVLLRRTLQSHNNRLPIGTANGCKSLLLSR